MIASLLLQVKVFLFSNDPICVLYVIAVNSICMICLCLFLIEAAGNESGDHACPAREQTSHDPQGRQGEGGIDAQQHNVN